MWYAIVKIFDGRHLDDDASEKATDAVNGALKADQAAGIGRALDYYTTIARDAGCKGWRRPHDAGIDIEYTNEGADDNEH